MKGWLIVAVLCLHLAVEAAVSRTESIDRRVHDRERVVNDRDRIGMRPVRHGPQGHKSGSGPWGACSKSCGGGVRTRVDNGQTQTMKCNNNPCRPVASDCDIDLVFVLDSSGSVSEFNWWKVKQFAIDIVRSLPIGSSSVRVGVATYSDSVQVRFHLNQHSSAAAVESTIWNLGYLPGGTNTAAALQTMRAAMFTAAHARPGAANVGILVTDGWSNSMAGTLLAGKQAKAAGITMYAVGIGNANMAELNGVSSDPDSAYVYQVTDFKALSQIVKNMAESACSTSHDCCNICGDPHYRTFDKQTIHYQGAPCQYNLASASNGDFTIKAGNEKRYSYRAVSYLEYMEVTFTSVTVRLGKHNVVSVNGKPVTLPHNIPGISITLSGGYVHLQLPNGVKVKSNGNACGDVCVPSTYKRIMTGICGNYDGNAANDLRTSSGTVVPGASRGYQDLGQSWKVDPTCVDDPYVPLSCSGQQRALAARRELCGQMAEKTGAFARCLPRVDTRALLEGCVQDVCAAGNNNVLKKAGACNALENLQELCEDAGVDVGDAWRKVAGCGGVPQYSPWSTWGACSATCRGVKTRQRECYYGNCGGPFQQKLSCGEIHCPRNGGWSAWGRWSPCSPLCGPGTRTRRRSCTKPTPAWGGNPCSGSSVQSSRCFSGLCEAEERTICPLCHPYTGSVCYMSDPSDCTKYYRCTRRPGSLIRCRRGAVGDFLRCRAPDEPEEPRRHPERPVHREMDRSRWNYRRPISMQCPSRTAWDQRGQSCRPSAWPCRR